MHIRPSAFEFDESDPFLNDTLERKGQIESLTRLIGNIEGPCVLAVDGAWGSGKTTFLTMWAQYLRKNRFRVAEFNAWETDFSNDPLMALYAALKEDSANLSTPDFKAALQAGAVVVSKLASAIPGIPDLADVYAAAKDQTETSVEVRLSRHRDAEEAIKEFKEALGRATRDGPPLVVCVDELDRCRPDYAIRFLEATKHIFHVDKVVFVLAVNLSELAKSVNALYGSNFNGETYLRRFVDYSIYLPEADRSRFFDDLLQSVGLSDRANSGTDIRHFLEIFVLGAPHMSLRDIEQAIHHLGIVLNAIPREPSPYRVPTEMIATTLMVVRMVAPDIYRKFTRDEVSDLQVLKGLNKLINRSDDWWKDPSHPQERTFPGSIRMEGILIVWGRHLSGSPEKDTPLLQLHKSEEEKAQNQERSGYSRAVISQARDIDNTYGEAFSLVLSLIDMIVYNPPRER